MVISVNYSGIPWFLMAYFNSSPIDSLHGTQISSRSFWVNVTMFLVSFHSLVVFFPGNTWKKQYDATLNVIRTSDNKEKAADDYHPGLTEAGVEFVKRQSTFVHKVLSQLCFFSHLPIKGPPAAPKIIWRSHQITLVARRPIGSLTRRPSNRTV